MRSEFPVAIKSMFRPHYLSWSEQALLEAKATPYLRNVIRIVTETGLRIYRELLPMKKAQVDLANDLVFVDDSKTPTGIAEVPLTPLAKLAIEDQLRIAGPGPWLFPSPREAERHLTTLQHAWEGALRRAGLPYFRIYDLRSTFATHLSSGGVADEWVTQLLRQSDASVFKKYSQMKLQMKREAMERLNRRANETSKGSGTADS